MPSFQGNPDVYDTMAREGLTAQRIQTELTATTDERVLIWRFNFLLYMADQYGTRQDEASLEQCLTVLDEVEAALKERYRERINELILQLIERGDLSYGIDDLIPVATDQRLQQCISNYDPGAEISFSDYLQQAITGRIQQDVQEVAHLDTVDASIVLDPMRSRETIADSLVSEALESLTPYQRVITCLTNGWQRQLKEEWIDQSRNRGQAVWKSEELKEFVRRWDGKVLEHAEVAHYLKRASSEEAEHLRQGVLKKMIINSKSTANLKLTQWARSRLKGSLFNPAHAIQAHLEQQSNRDQAIRELLGQTGIPGARLTDLQKFYLCFFLDLRDHMDLNWLPPEHRHKFQRWKEGFESRLTLTELGRRLGYSDPAAHVINRRQATFERAVTYIRISTIPEGVGTPRRNRQAQSDAFFRRLEEQGHLKVLLELEGDESALTNNQKIGICLIQGLRRYMNWDWIEDSAVRARAKDQLREWKEGEGLSRGVIGNIFGIHRAEVSSWRNRAWQVCQDWESERRGELVFNPKEALEQLAQEQDRDQRFAKFMKHLTSNQRKVFCIKYGYPEGLTAEERAELIDSGRWEGQRVISPTQISNILQVRTFAQVYTSEKLYLKKLSKSLRAGRC